MNRLDDRGLEEVNAISNKRFTSGFLTGPLPMQCCSSYTRCDICSYEDK